MSNKYVFFFNYCQTKKKQTLGSSYHYQFKYSKEKVKQIKYLFYIILFEMSPNNVSYMAQK